MVNQKHPDKMVFNEYTQWEAIKKEWEKISIKQYKKLRDSMPKRIALLKW